MVEVLAGYNYHPMQLFWLESGIGFPKIKGSWMTKGSWMKTEIWEWKWDNFPLSRILLQFLWNLRLGATMGYLSTALLEPGYNLVTTLLQACHWWVEERGMMRGNIRRVTIQNIIYLQFIEMPFHIQIHQV